MREGSFRNVLFLLIAAGVTLWLALVYNGMVKSKAGAQRAWADIETQYQRRLELIPNLVEVVKSYAQYEQETLLKVTEARRKLAEALTGNAMNVNGLAQAEREMRGGLKALFALVENYPDLKASQNYVGLQDQLEGTENRIAVARMRFNQAVRDFNQRLDMFPDAIIARLMSYQPLQFFEADDAARKPVQVDLDRKQD